MKIYTDEELAIIADVDRVTVTRWRTGARTPSWTAVKRIEEATGLPFEILLKRHPTAEEIEIVEKELKGQIRKTKEMLKKLREIKNAGDGGKGNE